MENLPIIIEVSLKKERFKAVTKKWNQFVKGFMKDLDYGYRKRK